MSHIHYFQRYSQKENVVTNNTLLLLSRLYQFSPARFERLINELIDDENSEINIGPSFTQQTVGVSSTPDGCIAQSSFKLLIETKLYGDLNADQLIRHLEHFKDEHQKFLLAIDSAKISDDVTQKVKLEAQQKDVIFLSTTFKQLIDSFKNLLSNHETEIAETLEDYEQFCLEMNLLQQDHQRMVAVVCGVTLQLNLKYSLYYYPVNRKFQPVSYLGLYSNKGVKALGKILYIVDVDYQKGLLTTHDMAGNKMALPTDRQDDVIEAIKTGAEKYNHHLTTGYRFFLVDQFHSIDFNKISPHGIVSKKYFDLSEYFTDELPDLTSEIAVKLNSMSFE